MVYSKVDEPAQFVGGTSEMGKFIAMNISYPQVVGFCDFYSGTRIYARFIVLKDGSISDISIIRGIEDCGECGEEVIRLVKSMPNWIPAKVNGQPVNSFFNLPVRFHPQ
ncbi:MAG TPA: energy transducer TonB [Fluviicola sp.]|nr:energy transducer TonB [Fluviicola sp.]